MSSTLRILSLGRKSRPGSRPSPESPGRFSYPRRSRHSSNHASIARQIRMMAISMSSFFSMLTLHIVKKLLNAA